MGDDTEQLSQKCQDEKHDECPGYEGVEGVALYCFCECHIAKPATALPVDRPRPRG
jgi:hypothetical protein